MGRVLEEIVRPARRPKAEPRAVGEPMKPPAALFDNGPSLLIWTDADERAYREGRGPPPF